MQFLERTFEERAELIGGEIRDALNLGEDPAAAASTRAKLQRHDRDNRV